MQNLLNRHKEQDQPSIQDITQKEPLNESQQGNIIASQANQPVQGGFKYRVGEHPSWGRVDYINVQGSTIPIKKGSAMRDEGKFHSNFFSYYL